MYETGTASGQIDLLNKLNTFLAGVSGWTVDYAPFTSPDNGSDKQMHIHLYDSEGDKNAYLTLVTRTTITYPCIRYQPSLSIDNTKNILQQPQSPSATYTPFASLPAASSFTYYFFATSTDLSIVCVMTGGWYQYIKFCMVDKSLDTYSNGYMAIGVNDMYNYNQDTPVYNYNNIYGRGSLVGKPHIYISSGSAGMGYFLKSNDSWSSMYYLAGGLNISSNFDYGYNFAFAGFNPGGVGSPFYQYLQNHSNATFPIIVPCLLSDHPASNQYKPIGYLPNVYFACLSGISAGQEFEVGADTYTCFPWWTQSTPLGGNTYWYNMGYAIKKVT